MDARLNGGVAQLGEHLPCKQGVKSSNLSVSIAMNIIIVHCRLYLENFIQNDDKMIKYLSNQSEIGCKLEQSIKDWLHETS